MTQINFVYHIHIFFVYIHVWMTMEYLNKYMDHETAINMKRYVTHHISPRHNYETPR